VDDDGDMEAGVYEVPEEDLPLKEIYQSERPAVFSVRPMMSAVSTAPNSAVEPKIPSESSAARPLRR